MANNQINTQINIQTNAAQANQQLASTNQQLNQLNQTQATNTTATQASTQAHNQNRQSVFENGGAVALLNEATGGLFMTLKDAVEASSLFSGAINLQTVAQRIYTAVTGRATAVTRGFSIALAATGIGAIIVLVGGLIAAYQYFASATEDAENAQKAFNASLEAGNRALAEQTSQIEFSTKVAIEKAKQRGASEQELFKIQQQGYLEIASAADDRVHQLFEEQQNVNNLIDDEEKRGEVSKKINEDIKKYTDEASKAREAYTLNELTNNTKIYEKSVETNKKISEDQQKKYDERLKAQEQYNQKALALQQSLEDKLEDVYDETEAQKAARDEEREIENVNKTITDETKRGELIALIRERYEKMADDRRKEAEQKQLDDRNEFLEKFNEKEDELQSFQDVKNQEQIQKIYDHNFNLLVAQEEADLAKATQLNASEEELQSIRDFYTGKQLDLSRQVTEANIKLGEEEKNAKLKQLNAISGALSQAGQIFGQQTAVGKAIAIAQTTIDTYKSATSAYAGMTAAIPGPVGIAAGIAAAAASVAMGIANVKKILSVKVPGAGGAAGGGPSGGAPTPPSFNIVGASSQNQLATTIAQQQNVPVTAQVVSTAMSTQQALDRNVVNNATFI